MLGVGAWGGSDMPKGLQRIYGQGHLHFIPFSCYRRLPLLRSARARNVFVGTLDRVRREYGFKLVGYVVMPEHVHLLVSEPARGNPSTVLKMLKQRVSRLPQAQTAPSSPGCAGIVSVRFAGKGATAAVLAKAIL